MVMHTSASTSSARRIFFDKGKPLYIYLATDVENHTTLVNNLRASGASTPFSPGDAQIILVAPGTQVASELLHAFPNKLFLDVEWALSALRTGSFASQNEGWGGHLVHPRRSETRDGVSSSISPLPTPRRTPIPMSDGQLPQQQTPVNVLDPATVLAYLSQAIGAVPAANPAMGPQVPMPAFQLPPGVTLPFLLPPGIPPAPQSGPVIQQPAPSPDIVNSLAQLLRAAQDQSSRNQFQAHQWPSQGVSASLLNASFPFTQTASHYAPLQSSSDSDLANTIMNALRSSASAGSASASLKRKSWQDSSDLATSGGGGEDAGMGHNTKHERMDEDFPSDGPKHVGRSGHNKRIFTDEDGSMLHFYVSPSLHNRPKIVDHIKKHGGKITADVPESHFVVLSNNSDHFYETLRSAVASDVPAVKADFIMESIRAKSLLDPAGFSFDGDTLRRKRGTPIVIDLAEIRRETHGEKKQKGKRPRNAGGERDRNSVESEDDEERSPDRVQKTPSSSHKGSKKFETAVPKARPKITKRRKTNEIRAEYKTPRSMSPIAPNTVVEVGGKHRFTEEEREYWPKYAAHVLKYDPSCTLTKLSQLLAAKMPHHTGPSWFTAILTPNRAKIEDLRKRAFIDARKADALKPHLNSVESSDQRKDETKVQESRPPVLVPRGRSMDLEQDMEIVTQFIMDGGADNIPDDADVWKALEEQHSCRTQKSWEAFWEEHGEEVTREVQDRSAVNAEVKVEPDA